ncbi:MAG: hypothetical protein V1921_04190 [Candidatus Altiarchaeota archaeon]
MPHIKTKKGQISTLDLVLASSIFIGILLISMTTWNDVLMRSYRFENKREINQKAMDVSELLVLTGGDPAYWHLFPIEDVNADNVTSIGLAAEPNFLDRDKIEKMAQVNYDTLRDIMGLSKEDFNITIYNSTNQAVYTMGIGESEATVVMRRYALLDGDNTRIELRLFYNISSGLTT